MAGWSAASRNGSASCVRALLPATAIRIAASAVIATLRRTTPAILARSDMLGRMALTPSTMLPLGTTLPSFRLPDYEGRVVTSDDFRTAPGLLVAFLCGHCPYVKHLRAGLAQLANDYQSRGVGIVGINSNDVANYPEDSPAKMAAEVRSAGYTFPYLFDDSQAVAKAYHAACTPDFFLFDRGRRLVYRGQFDESRPGNGAAVTGKDLRAAIDAVLAGKPTSTFQSPSMGCNIKWKRGNEPQYAR